MLIPLRALQDRVIVKRIEEAEKKIGTFYVPDVAKEKPQRGVVLSVGSGYITPAGTLIPIDVADGDTVLFGKYSGTEVEVILNGVPEPVLILKADEILAVEG